MQMLSKSITSLMMLLIFLFALAVPAMAGDKDEGTIGAKLRVIVGAFNRIIAGIMVPIRGPVWLIC